ncbi:MAG: polysaccharide deacetylase family protein [Candidatus Devosia euplotis]|nr:polysaccharide deacetylase family protein [Candidatus Devosia euplotis]
MSEDQRVTLVRNFVTAYGYDLERQCRELIMDWPELRHFASEPFCTIGAHTVYHYELAKLSLDRARNKMARSADILLSQLGQRPAHFSYPLGRPLSAGPRELALARELGFASAVTTRPGGLYRRHVRDPFALLRVSLNGYFQPRHYVDIFATGTIFSLPGRLTG